MIAACLGGTAAASNDTAAIDVSGTDGLYRVTAGFAVDATPSQAIAALTDYDQIPRFMPEVRLSQVRERSEAFTVVEQEAVARFLLFSRRVHLILEVHEASDAIRFRDICGKSFRHYEGAWGFAERDGRTNVTYELMARPSFDVPDFVLRRLLKRDANVMVERLKRELDARAGARRDE